MTNIRKINAKRNVGIYPFNPQKYDRSYFDPILVKKYEHWIEMGRPDDMLVEIEEIQANAPEPNNSNQPNREVGNRWDPPPPLDLDGNPVRGRWVWIEGEEDDTLNESPSSSTSGQKSSSFLDIVANRMNQSMPTSIKKRGKRVNMNAAIITHEEIDEQLQTRVIDETPKKITKRRRTAIVDSSEDESGNDSTLDSDDLSGSDEDQCAEYGFSDDEELSKFETVKRILNKDTCDEEYKGKLFAVHFDKPKKFYIGCLEHTFCEEPGSEVNEVMFKFLDFKGDGRYYLKPNTVVEKVPARNVFLGPIAFDYIKNGGYLLKNTTFEEISHEWSVYCTTFSI